MSYKHYYKNHKRLLANTSNQLPGATINQITTTHKTTHHRHNQQEFLNLTETILEGQYISCYLINSEPRLCLSQLLSKVLINFPIEQIRDKFCELGIYCRPCTPAQLQLLKSHCILPKWVNLCGLITKSDAERLCLDLFNTIIPKKKLDIESLMPHQQQQNSSLPIIHNYFAGNERNHDAYIGMLLSQRPMTGQSFRDNLMHTPRQKIEQDQQDSPINYTSKRKSADHDETESITKPTTNCTYQVCRSSDKASTPIKLDYLFGPNFLQTYSGNIKNFLIEIDRHRELVSMASNTSTLMLSIRVYHRCIGKCTGLYYPAFYHHPNSQCIECTNCHYLFSPMRFIGHTHGSKESRVCHWGLDSSKWKHYIRLSKTQPTNNLEEQELVNIFYDMQNRFEYTQSYTQRMYTEFYNRYKKSADKYSHTDSHNATHSKGYREYDQIRKCKQTTATCNSANSNARYAENSCGNKRVKLLDHTNSTNRSSRMDCNSLVSGHNSLSHNGTNFETCQDLSLLSGLEKILTRNGAKFDFKQEIIEEALLIVSKVRATTLLNNLTTHFGSLNQPNYQT